MSKINVRKLYLALCHENDGVETYDAPEYVPGVQQFSAKPKFNTATNYEEGVLTEQDNTLENIDMSFDIGHMSNTQIAKYLGQHVAATGGVYASADDVAPYVAILYEYEKGNHKLGWKVYYKGILTDPDDNVKQKEGKTEYQNHTVAATFQPLKGHAHQWKYTIEEDDPNCPENMATTFFQNVIIPEEDTTVPTVTVTPADAAAAVPVGSNIVWTFSETIVAALVNAANFFVMKASDGTLVPGTLTIDSANKVVTFDPTADLAAATAYVAICTTNITDLAGNHLAAVSLTHFTTA